MGALAYLEFRYALHRAQAILRSPLRLLVWAPYVYFVGYFAISRSTNHGGAPGFTLTPAYGTAIGGGYLGLLGVSAALAAGGRVAGFRTPAEAIMFSNARLRPLTIVLWLQLRKLGSSPMRWLGAFFYLFAIAAPKNADTFVPLRALLAVVLLLTLTMGIELPAFLLGRGRVRPFLRVICWTVTALGAAYALAGVIGDRVLLPLDAILHLDPGPIVVALLHGNLIALAAIALFLAALAASVVLLGDDALPELYAASLGLRLMRKRRRRRNAKAYAFANPAQSVRVPGGAFALVWKDWIGFRRARGSLRLWLLGAAAWAGCGVAVGLAKINWNDPAPVLTLVTGSAVLVVVIAPFNASVGLAGDLSKPLFWLNAAPLRACIAAWTAARSWRAGVLLGLAPMAAGCVIGNAMLVEYSVPLSLCAYWSLQALGVGLYAIFPDPIDARGPMLLVRLFVTALYIAPALLAYGIISIFSGLDGIALFCAGLLLVLQGYGVLELAAYRFREYGASIATISRAT